MVAMRDSFGTALAVGPFAGFEPLGFEAGDNNWYRFVANGPTGSTDPSGLCEPGDREIQILGGSAEQQELVQHAIKSAQKKLDAAIKLLEKDWGSYVSKNPDGIMVTPILKDETERVHWLGKLREARASIGKHSFGVDISGIDKGKGGPGDSPAEVACWENFLGNRWWAKRITIKPPFFDPKSTNETRAEVLAHEFARLVGIADGERGPRDNVNNWDNIIRAAETFYRRQP